MAKPSPLAPDLAARIAALPPPFIVFNKSHSGSRFLTAMLQSQGIFMGSELNESRDALPFLPLVEQVVLQYYPDFQPLWRQPEWPVEIQDLLARGLDAHLAGHREGSAWGWKLCETAYILPLLGAIFPDGRFVHLIRDGRDVAYSDHIAPEQPFWRKIYFASDTVRSWAGMRLDQAAYERRPHLFNAWHWQESVRVGRSFGSMLGPGYREVHYERLCTDFVAESRELLEWLGIRPDGAALAALAAEVDPRPVAKYRRRPRAQQRGVQRLIEPALLACGYACEPLPYSWADNSAALLQRLNRSVNRRMTRHG